MADVLEFPVWKLAPPAPGEEAEGPPEEGTGWHLGGGAVVHADDPRTAGRAVELLRAYAEAYFALQPHGYREGGVLVLPLETDAGETEERVYPPTPETLLSMLEGGAGADPWEDLRRVARDISTYVALAQELGAEDTELERLEEWEAQGFSPPAPGAAVWPPKASARGVLARETQPLADEMDLGFEVLDEQVALDSPADLLALARDYRLVRGLGEGRFVSEPVYDVDDDTEATFELSVEGIDEDLEEAFTALLYGGAMRFHALMNWAYAQGFARGTERDFPDPSVVEDLAPHVSAEDLQVLVDAYRNGHADAWRASRTAGGPGEVEVLGCDGVSYTLGPLEAVDHLVARVASAPERGRGSPHFGPRGDVLYLWEGAEPFAVIGAPGLLWETYGRVTSLLREKDEPGESVVVVVRVPPEFHPLFPESRHAEDDSPPHFTVLYVGPVPDDRHEDVERLVREVAERHGPFELTFGEGVEWFTNDEGQEIAHKGVDPVSEDLMRSLHDDLRAAFEDAGLEVKHHTNYDYIPHATLDYRDERVYEDEAPEGSFLVDALEVWGLSEHDMTIPL